MTNLYNGLITIFIYLGYNFLLQIRIFNNINNVIIKVLAPRLPTPP